MGWFAVKISVDTNVLVRGVVLDDPKQSQTADKLLKSATVIAVSLSCLCEFTWVLRKVYKFSSLDVSAAIRALYATSKVEMNRPAVEAGLSVQDAGGDFADGVIAYEGRWLGGETFVSFDKTAVRLVSSQGYESRLLS